MSRKAKKELTQEFAQNYRRSSKKEKSRLLNYFVELTGYNRAYASYLLSRHSKTIKISPLTQIKLDAHIKFKRKRTPLYDEQVKKALLFFWEYSDFACGKRLKPLLPILIYKNDQFHKIPLPEEIRKKLLCISPSTIDRLLHSDKEQRKLKNRSKTKPGTLLKKQIPVRIFNEWDEKRPGFFEIDLVAHTQENAKGEFCHTLCAVDVYSGWTEVFALKNRAQKWVFEALEEMRKGLPFPLLGIDSDNGPEFINDHLKRYCLREGITFTRSRPYRKNDNCYVEQKNYSVVRKFVGYMRHDTEEELEILKTFYKDLRLYVNFFQGITKLLYKEREGGKVRKRYDLAKTPYERLLESEHISDEAKEALREEYEGLNPFELYERIRRHQKRLYLAYLRKKGIVPKLKLKVERKGVK